MIETNPDINFLIATENEENFSAGSQKPQGKEKDVTNRLQAVLEKYGAVIAKETLATELVEEVANPVISKEIAVGGQTVTIQIGLAR